MSNEPILYFYIDVKLWNQLNVMCKQSKVIKVRLKAGKI